MIIQVNGPLVEKLKKPAIIFNKENNKIHKIGEFEHLENYLNNYILNSTVTNKKELEKYFGLPRNGKRTIQDVKNNLVIFEISEFMESSLANAGYKLKISYGKSKIKNLM